MQCRVLVQALVRDVRSAYLHERSCVIRALAKASGDRTRKTAWCEADARSPLGHHMTLPFRINRGRIVKKSKLIRNFHHLSSILSPCDESYVLIHNVAMAKTKTHQLSILVYDCNISLTACMSDVLCCMLILTSTRFLNSDIFYLDLRLLTFCHVGHPCTHAFSSVDSGLLSVQKFSVQSACRVCSLVKRFLTCTTHIVPLGEPDGTSNLAGGFYGSDDYQQAYYGQLSPSPYYQGSPYGGGAGGGGGPFELAEKQDFVGGDPVSMKIELDWRFLILSFLLQAVIVGVSLVGLLIVGGFAAYVAADQRQNLQNQIDDNENNINTVTTRYS